VANEYFASLQQECQGLIPRICKMLFNRMAAGKEKGATYRTEVSYLEIYNERVKDLLQPSSTNHSLRVREHPRHGPYVQGLSRHLVTDYSDIQVSMLVSVTVLNIILIPL
jgi:kinesin family protein 16B